MSLLAKQDVAIYDQHIRQFGYAGDVSAQDAWLALQEMADSVLVDVRTPQEWELVGVPDASSAGKTVVRLSWMIAPGEMNMRFIDEFKNLPVSANASVLLICKSGGRSQAAAIALTQAGYSRCFNVSGGFEGTSGWRAASLPWIR